MTNTAEVRTDAKTGRTSVWIFSPNRNLLARKLNVSEATAFNFLLTFNVPADAIDAKTV